MIITCKNHNFNFFFSFSVDLIMSARLSVSKPTALRKSTLALHRMKSKDHEGFEEVRQFVKQVGNFFKAEISWPVDTCIFHNDKVSSLKMHCNAKNAIVSINALLHP